MLNACQKFYTGRECFSRLGQFWKLEPSGKAMAVAWDNLIKIGKANGKGMPNTAILDWEDRWFGVVSFEVLSPATG